MNHISDTTDIGITFQMTLDAFLDETHPVKDTNQNTYRDALKSWRKPITAAARKRNRRLQEKRWGFAQTVSRLT